MKAKADVKQTETYGVSVKFTDREIADLFDDFLTEKTSEHYTMRFDLDGVTFFLLSAVEIKLVEQLIERFETDLA
ncbi:MAG TPA: hypothetical protein VF574_01070 [Allosphingosinicella sp.]|jgi:hypothetical protein